MLMTQRTHPFPCRTRKLSFVVPKILGGRLPGKIGKRRHFSFFIVPFRYSSIAQSVEHAAVNRGVVGSSPTGGAKSLRNRMIMRFLFSLTRFLHDFIQDLHCALLFAGIKMGIGIPCHLNIGMA